jgi:hypothetical protein
MRVACSRTPHGGGRQLPGDVNDERPHLPVHDIPDAKIAEVPVRFPTHGATNRIAAVLICEKEGFDELLRAEGIPDRYDVALMSTKGSRHWPPAIWPSPSTSLASPFTT